MSAGEGIAVMPAWRRIRSWKWFMILAVWVMAFLVSFLIFPLGSPLLRAQDAQDAGESPESSTSAESTFSVPVRAAVLLDVHTGQILFEKQADERIPPASLTKILTMVLGLDAVKEGRFSVDDEVVVSEEAWRLALAASRGAISSMYLEVGDRVSLEELFYGIGVVSGNDASLALAEFIAGDEAVFVDQMNRRAQEIGMTDSHFEDCHGLSPESYTTARDMARLAAYFVREHPEGLAYTRLKEFTYNGITQPNYNRLVVRDPRVTGLKTGFLSVSGYHLVATAEEGEMSLVAVVMGAESPNQREQVALQMLNYGFGEFRTISPAWGDHGRKTIRVYKGTKDAVAVAPSERVVVTVPVGDVESLDLSDALPPYLEAPVKAGEVVGTLEVKAGMTTVREFDLVITEDVERAGWIRVLLDSLRLFVTELWNRFLGGGP